MFDNISFFSFGSVFQLKLGTGSFYPWIRYQAFSVSDYLGACGGLMGLIAGVSVISIIEFALTFTKCFQCRLVKSKIAPEELQRPRPRKSFLMNRDHLFYHLGRNFVEFLRESGIHGVRYTNDKKLKVLERLFWVVTIVISVTFCSILTMESLNQLQSNSVAIALGEQIWTPENVRRL